MIINKKELSRLSTTLPILFTLSETNRKYKKRCGKRAVQTTVDSDNKMS
jgi:hypothetical protein